MKYIKVLLLISICFVSCTESKYTTMMDMFVDSCDVETTTMPIDIDSIRNPYIMTCLNGRLFFADIFQPTFITVFDSKEGDYFGDFAKKGQGPDEFIHLSNISFVDNRLVLWDSGKSILTLATVDTDDLSSTEYQRVEIKPDSSLISAFQVFALKDDLFIASGIVKHHRFVLLDKYSKFISSFGNYPQINKNKSDVENGLAYQCLLTYQSEKKVLVAGNGIGESISFYSLNNIHVPRIIKEYIYANPVYDYTGDESQPVVFKKDNVVGVVDIKSSLKYCICLFSGEPRNAENYGGNKILFFDWDGNPIKALMLKQQYSNMAIDEDQGKIWLLGTDPNTSDFIVSGIELPE